MTLNPALAREVDRRTTNDVEKAMNAGAEAIALAEAKVRRELDNAAEAATIVESLGKLAIGSGTKGYLVVALATEHRTILGQIMAAVSEAVVATTEPTETSGYCPGDGRDIFHARHDGRLKCDTVIAAHLAEHQPII